MTDKTKRLDGEAWLLIYANLALVTGAIFAGLFWIAVPLLALTGAILLGASLSVLVWAFIKFQWPGIKLMAKAFVDVYGEDDKA